MTSVHEPPADRFTDLVRSCPVLDLGGPLGLDAFFAQAAQALVTAAELPAEQIHELLVEREAESPTVLMPFLAIPHLIIPGQDRFGGLMARCRQGVRFNESAPAVRCVFVLVASRDRRGGHLGALAAIAQVAQNPEFEQRWLEAPDEAALRKAVLDSRPPAD